MAEQWVFPGATLVRVIDGDSFLARLEREVDFGFRVKMRGESVQRFRLAGVSSADVRVASGQGARQRLLGLLWTAPFTLTSLGPYKYGDTWMADVVLADGRNVRDVMIAEQWSAPWNGRGTPPLPPWPRTVA